MAALQGAVRERSPHLDRDRQLAGDIESVAQAVRNGSLVAAVEAGATPLL